MQPSCRLSFALEACSVVFQHTQEMGPVLGSNVLQRVDRGNLFVWRAVHGEPLDWTLPNSEMQYIGENGDATSMLIQLCFRGVYIRMHMTS